MSIAESILRFETPLASISFQSESWRRSAVEIEIGHAKPVLFLMNDSPGLPRLASARPCAEAVRQKRNHPVRGWRNGGMVETAAQAFDFLAFTAFTATFLRLR